MIVYYSTLVYTCIIAYIGMQLYNKKALCNNISTIHSHNSLEQKTISLLFAVLSFALLVFFVGMRSDYADTANYINSFNNLNPNLSFENIIRIFTSDQKSPGFLLFQNIVKTFITQNSTVFLFIIAIFQAGAIIRLYYKYSTNYLFSVYLFIATVSFTWMMNGIRQFFAVTIILYFIDLLIEKKFLKFAIVIVIASTFHSSALVWLPVMFLVHQKPWSKKVFLFLLITLSILYYLFTYTSFLGEPSAVAEATVGDTGVNPIRVIVYSIPAILAFWKRKIIESKATPLINILINLSMVTTGAYLLAIFTSGILMGRVPIYFELFGYILLPWLLKNAFEDRDRKILTFFAVISYFVYFYYNIVVLGLGFYSSHILNLHLR